MAAAEARAAWQRAANRCLVQEDRKRAPKLACCPSSAEHGTNNGNCRNAEDRPISNFMPLSWNPMNSNLPPDVRWRVQLQPNFGIQKDLASERICCLGRDIDEKKVEDSASKPKHEETLFCEAVDTKTKKSGDIFEPPEKGLQDLMTVGCYSQASKCRQTASNCFYKDNEFPGFEFIDPEPLKNPEKDFDMDVPWKEGEKTQPWWQIADENELALLVAERVTQHIENCDLPRPTQTVPVHRTEPYTRKHIGDYGGPSSPAGRLSHFLPGQCDHVKCSYSTASTYTLRCAFFSFTTLSSCQFCFILSMHKDDHA